MESRSTGQVSAMFNQGVPEERDVDSEGCDSAGQDSAQGNVLTMIWRAPPALLTRRPSGCPFLQGNSPGPPADGLWTRPERHLTCDALRAACGRAPFPGGATHPCLLVFMPRVAPSPEARLAAGICFRNRNGKSDGMALLRLLYNKLCLPSFSPALLTDLL